MPSSIANHKKSTLNLGQVNQIPQEYAKPIRKTGYLMAHPHILHDGKMLPGEGREFPSVLNWNMPRNSKLTDLKMSNEVNFSSSRVMDARGMQAIP